jgi:hypothetical protein
MWACAELKLAVATTAANSTPLIRYFIVRILLFESAH